MSFVFLDIKAGFNFSKVVQANLFTAGNVLPLESEWEKSFGIGRLEEKLNCFEAH